MSISFDRIADRYDTTRGFPPGIAQQIADEIARETKLQPGERLLEIGVGTGRIALPLQARMPSIRYVGTDISASMLARLLQGIPAGAALLPLRADATRLPFVNHCFAAMLESHVLHLVASIEEVLTEAHRLLHPGGLFLSCYNRHPDDHGPIAELRHRRWAMIVAELGGEQYLRDPIRHRERIITHLRHAFGEPRTIELASWQEQTTPRILLDQIARRTWSSSWDVPEPLFQESLTRLTAWANEQIGDLDQLLVNTTSFWLEIYAKPA